MFQDVVHTLSRMGVKKGDVRVYLACLARREGVFIHELVKETKSKRSTVYLSIKRLMEIGYVAKARTGNRWQYYAETPDTLVARQEMLLDDLKTLAPLLKKLKSNDAQTEIRFYEGADGIQKAYETMLTALKFAEGDRKQIRAFMSNDHTKFVFTDWQRQFIDKRVRLGAKYRVISQESARVNKIFTNDPKQLREARYIADAQFPFKVAMEVADDLVFLYSPVAPVGGVTIRNRAIADSLAGLFAFVWNTLPADGAAQ